jgi:cytochrome P450
VFNNPPLHTRVRTLIIGARTRGAISGFEAGLVMLGAERCKSPNDPEHDVLTRLIGEEQTDGKLSETELLQNCVFILNAGHETITTLIVNALVALTEHPHAKADLLSKQELLAHDSIGLEAYLTIVIEEFLCFEPSNQLSNRRSLKDTQIGGVAWTAKTKGDNHARPKSLSVIQRVLPVLSG